MRTALMNELHKLRTDNQDLLSKLDRSSLDSLDLLESQIADQKCVNSSLQVRATIRSDGVMWELI
jgi:xylose isomerase